MVAWTLGLLVLEFLPPPFHPEQFYSFHMLAFLVRSEESRAKNSLNETILLQMRRLSEEAEWLDQLQFAAPPGQKNQGMDAHLTYAFLRRLACAPQLFSVTLFGYWASRPVVFTMGSPGQPAAAASLGNLSKIQILGPHPRPIGNLCGVRPNNLGFKKLSGTTAPDSSHAVNRASKENPDTLSLTIVLRA